VIARGSKPPIDWRGPGFEETQVEFATHMLDLIIYSIFPTGIHEAGWIRGLSAADCGSFDLRHWTAGRDALAMVRAEFIAAPSPAPQAES